MTRRSWLPSALLALGLALGACGSDGDGGNDSSTETAVAGASVEVAQLSPEDGAALLAERSELTIIDVRTPEEYAPAHLEGAINIDVEAADFDARVAELGTDGGVAVYCQSGRRSALAAARLVGQGFTDVHDLGGIQAWIAAGNPVVTA